MIAAIHIFPAISYAYKFTSMHSEEHAYFSKIIKIFKLNNELVTETAPVAFNVKQK